MSHEKIDCPSCLPWELCLTCKGKQQAENLRNAQAQEPLDDALRQLGLVPTTGRRDVLRELVASSGVSAARLPLKNPRVQLIEARNNLMAAIVALRGGFPSVMDACDEAIAALDIAIGLAFCSETPSRLSEAVTQIEALLEWAIGERAYWSEQNADRYWQMERVVRQVEDVLKILSSPALEGRQPEGE